MGPEDPSSTWTDEEVVSTKPDGFEDVAGRYADPTPIGQGSVGRVLAIHDRRLARDVAYKELVGRPSTAAVGRFLREARVTARLEHPNITPIYDSGRGEDGTYYYTMRYVRGRTFKETLEACDGLAERLALLPHFVDLCQATAYAHGQGVIHRDLKPGNVMVGAYGETLLVDWGLAKLVEETVPRDDEHPTGVGVVMGTPRYMSPEQAFGYLDSIDQRSDVWSLGVMLFELLTGQPPFDAPTTAELLQMVRTAPVPDIRSVAPNAPAELAAVAQKALQRDPTERYPDARALLDELLAWQSGALVSAYTYTTWDRVRLHLVRHRLSYGVGAVALALLALLAVVSGLRIVDERDRALHFAAQARAAEAQARAAEAEARGSLAVSYVGKALTALEDGEHVDAELYAAEALTLVDSPEARGILANVRAHWHPTWSRDLDAPGGCQGIGWLSDGGLVCTSREGTRVWDGEVLRWSKPHPGRALALGERVLVSGGNDAPFQVLDVATGEVLETYEHRSVGFAAALGPEDRLFAYASGQRLTVRDRVSGTEGIYAAPDIIHSLAFVDDGLVVISQDNVLTLLSLPGLRELATERLGKAGSTGISLAPGGRRIAIGTGDKDVVLYDLDSRQVEARLVGHTGPVATASWSSRGLLATGSEDHTVRVWDPSDARELARLPGWEGWFGVATWSPDGRQLAAASRLPMARVWDVPERRTPVVSTRGGLSSVALSPDDRWMATTSGIGWLEVWDTRTGAPVHATRIHPQGLLARQAVFSPDGAWLVVVLNLAPPVVLDTRSWAPVQTLESLRSATNAAFTEDGTQLWVLQADGLQAVDPSTWVPSAPVPGTSGRKTSLTVASGWVSWADDEGAHVYEIASGTHTPHPTRSLREATLSRDGQRVALSLSDFTIRIFDRATWTERAVLTGHEQIADDLAWSPDDRWLASTGWDTTVRVWNPDSGALRAVLPGHAHRAVSAQFDTTGSRLVSASWDHTARIWDGSAWELDPATLRDEARCSHALQIEDARRVPRWHGACTPD